MRKNKSGFTIVELLVVIAVIGILTTIGILSFTRYQSNSRDTQRSSRTTLIAEALEKYYDKNGEYPSCSALTQSAATVDTAVLPGIDPLALLTPKSATSDTNSIKCTDLTGASTDPDVFAYVGDGSANCITNTGTGASCLSWTLKYIDESTGTVKTLQSRRNTAIATSGTTPLTATGAGFTQINLSWNTINNAVSYDIQRATDSGFTANLSTQTVTGTSASITGLTYNTQYYFQIRANAASSQGPWSSTANASTWVLGTPVPAAAGTGFTSINTSWAATPNATSYDVQRATDSGFTANLSTQTVAATSSSFTGLTYNTQYYFRVRATVASGQGSWSSSQIATTWIVGTPTTTAVTTSTTTFTTSWAATSYATSYNVQCSSNGSTWSGCTGSTTGLSFGWGPTWQGTPLYFRTQAANGSYLSAWSNTAGATTGIDNPAAFPLYSTNLLPNWNYLNVGSGVSCPAGTSPSSDWYVDTGGGNTYWLTGGVSQSYGLGWNTSVTVSVASRCTTAYTSSGFVWANNTASMSLPWSSVSIDVIAWRHLGWSATCPQWTTSSSYDWWVMTNNGTWGAGENGIQYTDYYNPGIIWGDGDARVAIHCYGPWGGDARSDNWVSFGTGCYPTILSSWCTY